MSKTKGTVMSNVEPVVEPVVEQDKAKTDFSVEIKISDKNLSYRSDFAEAETIFWLEAVKGLIIKNAFEKSGLEQS